MKIKIKTRKKNNKKIPNETAGPFAVGKKLTHKAYRETPGS
jgi:hypothetical protein